MSSIVSSIMLQKKKWSVIVLSALGLAVSLYINFFIEKGDNAFGCKIGQVFNCETVINSPYGKVFGISLALIGAFYFLCLFAIYAVDYYDDYLIAIIAIAGLVSVIDFIYIELLVLNTFCLYCTIVHIIVIIIFSIIGPESIKNSIEKIKNR